MNADDLPGWLLDFQPMLTCGGSGAGKTSLANCLQQTDPRVSIFFDLDEEPIAGHDVHSIDELEAALRDGHDQIVIRSPTHVVREPPLFEDTVRYLLELGNELREAGQGEILFQMDEIQDLQERWVQVAQKRLRKRRIKPVGYSQDPVSVPKRARTIANWNGWLSRPPADLRESLETMAYPVELLVELEPYDLLVFNDSWQPVGRFRAPEGYAVE